MKDKDIIKALECCNKQNCADCPLYNGNSFSEKCKAICFKEATSLINRQQEEIERLRKEVNLVSIQFQDLQERYEEAQTENERLKKLKCFEIFIDERIQKSNELGLRREFRTKDDYDEAFKKEIEKLYDISTATVEAIKEFAERLKKYVFNTQYHIDRYYRRTIDKLVKEIVGE